MIGRPPVDAIDRFMSLVNVTENCWEWLAFKNERGYGQFQNLSKQVRAHRFIYEYCYGEIKKPLEIDHLCRNRSCVNPHHLEAVTTKENAHRSNSITGINSRKTKCPKGHPLNGKNLYITPKLKGRSCKICRTYAVYKSLIKKKIKEKTR